MPMATPIGVVSEKKSAIATIDLRRNLACDEREKSLSSHSSTLVYFRNYTFTLITSMGSIQIQKFNQSWFRKKKDKNHEWHFYMGWFDI
jgi:hypothetical protein